MANQDQVSEKSDAESDRIEELEREIRFLNELGVRLFDALEFYADPATYFAIGFFPDPPNGDFMNDFSETELGHKPGKLARETLDSVRKEIAANPSSENSDKSV